MKHKIYIDGREGTTGLQIYERLGGRDDLELLLIDEDKRKDTEERRKFLNAADIVFLCLPDAAAKEAVSLIENDNTRVIDSRPADENNSIRRRRVCDECSRRFTTYEKVETIPLIVIKKDDNRETYDRSKIEGGVIRACHKRPISADQIRTMIDEVEAAIFKKEEREISSGEIGELVMEKLKDLDSVAYVRFASVYREFKDVNTFMDELKKMLG